MTSILSTHHTLRVLFCSQGQRGKRNVKGMVIVGCEVFGDLKIAKIKKRISHNSEIKNVTEKHLIEKLNIPLHGNMQRGFLKLYYSWEHVGRKSIESLLSGNMIITFKFIEH